MAVSNWIIFKSGPIVSTSSQIGPRVPTTGQIWPRSR